MLSQRLHLLVGWNFWTGILLLLPVGSFAGAGSGRGPAAEEIQRSHDQALVAEDAPFLMAEMGKPGFLEEFGQKNCGFLAGETKRGSDQLAKCNRLFTQEALRKLADRYFGADRKAIEARCEKEPLACRDSLILEGWYRQAHNQAVEASRQEKLRKLASGSSK